MEKILEFVKSDNYILVLNCLIIILFIGFIAILINNYKLNKKYKTFMRKLGKGRNIEEDLERFMQKIDKVEDQNVEIMNFCKNLDEDVSKCIQKIGVVRYSAFKDTGSDLSFAVALLDEKNDGVVFNGIYSREMSNIYAKPVNNGNSNYTLSEQEIEAIEKAMNSNSVYKMR